MDPLLRASWPTLERVLPRGCRVVVATSGGPDSQALLHLLAQAREALEVELVAVGVDHGLRPGAGAELDGAAALAGVLGIPFCRVAVQVRTAGEGLQAAARAARRDALRAQARALGARRIALGHTATDQAETVLYRLSRGTSLRGLGAMAPRRGPWVRPLLGATRDEVRAYLQRHDLRWAEDPSNQDPRFARTRVRREVLGVLQALHGGADRQIARLAALAREDEGLLGRLASDAYQRCAGPLGSLRPEVVAELERPLARRVIARWLGRHAIRPTHQRISRIVHGIADGRLACMAEGRRIRLERGRLWIEPPAPDYTAPVPFDGEVRLPPWGLPLRARTRRGRGQILPDPSRGVAFDRAGLHFGLWARPWRRGDRVRPFGMSGHIKVSDLFTNHRVPTALRTGWPVVLHGDEIVWVVGLRRGAAAPVTASTGEVTCLEVGEDLASARAPHHLEASRSDAC